MKTVLLLDDSARPMDLAAIHAEGKFCLRTRPGGGTLNIYDPTAASAAAISDHVGRDLSRPHKSPNLGPAYCLRVLFPLQSHMKSLFVSERTTAEQVIRLLLDGYDSKKDDEKHFSLFEVLPAFHIYRMMRMNEKYR